MADPFERAPIAGAPLSLILLAYNEGPSFEGTIGKWLTAVLALKRECEVIVVDDGSTDETGPRADSLAKSRPALRVLHHEQRRGLGAALRTGLAAARHPLVATATCDGQYDPADLQRLLKGIDKVDLVTGVRQWRPVPGWLRGLGMLYRLIARVVFGVSLEPRATWLGWSGLSRRLFARWAFALGLQDVECVLRLYRRAILPRLVIQSDGPFALIELLAKANFLGCLLSEVPVSYQPRAQNLIASTDRRPQTWAETWRVFKVPDFGAVKV